MNLRTGFELKAEGVDQLLKNGRVSKHVIFGALLHSAMQGGHYATQICIEAMPADLQIEARAIEQEFRRPL